MANLVRRRQESERSDPWSLVRQVLSLDPFQGMLAVPSAQQQQQLWIPDFEVKETPEAYVFKADLPGVKESDLDIQLQRNRLIVSGKREEERRDENDTYYAVERVYGSFTRAFTLPEGVDPEHVKAELKDGVLTLTVPKRPEERPKKIDVQASSQQKQQQQPQQPSSQPQPKAKA